MKLGRNSLNYRSRVAFKKAGQIEVGQDILDNDSVKETLNVFDTVEGFMESLLAIHLPIVNYHENALEVH